MVSAKDLPTVSMESTPWFQVSQTSREPRFKGNVPLVLALANLYYDGHGFVREPDMERLYLMARLPGARDLGAALVAAGWAEAHRMGEDEYDVILSDDFRVAVKQAAFRGSKAPEGYTASTSLQFEDRIPRDLDARRDVYEQIGHSSDGFDEWLTGYYTVFLKSEEDRIRVERRLMHRIDPTNRAAGRDNETRRLTKRLLEKMAPGVKWTVKQAYKGTYRTDVEVDPKTPAAQEAAKRLGISVHNWSIDPSDIRVPEEYLELVDEWIGRKPTSVVPPRAPTPSTTSGTSPATVTPEDCTEQTFEVPGFGQVRVVCGKPGKTGETWYNVSVGGKRYGWNGSRWSWAGEPPAEVLAEVRKRSPIFQKR